MGLDLKKSFSVVEIFGGLEVSVFFIDIKKFDDKDFNVFDLEIFKLNKMFWIDGLFIYFYILGVMEKLWFLFVVVKEMKDRVFV